MAKYLLAFKVGSFLEKGRVFYAFRCGRKTWLRGKRVQEDINNFWMGHAPRDDVGDLFSFGFGTRPASGGGGVSGRRLHRSVHGNCSKCCKLLQEFGRN